MADLQIVNACLLGQAGLWNIEVTKGIVTQVDCSESLQSSHSVQETKTLDAQGQLVIPGLVDAHMHLDKVFLLDRCHAIEGNFQEAMQETLKAKQLKG